MRDTVGGGGRLLLSSTLVGRARELATLERMWADACGGQGAVVIISGPAGIGKSRLARELCGAAERDGGRVLHGRAVAGPLPVAFRPVAEALVAAERDGLIDVDDEAIAAFRPALSRVLPAWRDGMDLPDDSVVVVAEGVLRVLRHVAGDGRACLVVLEDVHWADPETLAIVEYLTDHVRSGPVLVVATVRDEHTTPGLELARSLAAGRRATVVRLDRLSDDDVVELSTSCLGGEPAGSEVHDLVARADGVPFLVEELLGVAATSGALVRQADAWHLAGGVDHLVPLTFAESVRRRLASIGEPARSVLGAAAVLGRRFDWSLLASATGLDDAAVDAALRESVGAQLVDVEPDGGFRFRHALTRDAVLADRLPSERSRDAARALDAVLRAHPDLPGPWRDLAADLAEHAGERRRAVDILLGVARRSSDDGALATAVAALDRARRLADGDVPTVVAIDEELIELLGRTGELDRAMRVGDEVLGRVADARRRTEVHLRLARAAIASRRWALADRFLSGARDGVDPSVDRTLVARIDVAEAHVSLLRDPARAAELARHALGTAEHAGLHELAREALELIGRVERSRDLDCATDAFTRALHLATEQGSRLGRLDALHELATIELLRTGATEALEHAHRLAGELGAPATMAVLDVQLGAAWSIRDDPEPGVAASRRAAELAQRFRLGEVHAAALAFEGACHARAGRRDELDRCVAAAIELDGDGPELAFNLAFARAQHALLVDDRAAAITLLAERTVDASAAVGVQATGPNAGLLALLTASAGDTASAERWTAQIPVHVLARGWGAYADAVLAGRAGDAAAAERLVAEGDRRLAELAWYRHLGRRHVADAALGAGWGDPATWMLDALRFFDARGEAQLASACRSLLRRAGAAVPRRRAVLPPDGRWQMLGATAREAEVLDLLATGLANREIATRLYMSHRTVERHVANLITKTGVVGRTELVALAARTSPQSAPA